MKADRQIACRVFLNEEGIIDKKSKTGHIRTRGKMYRYSDRQKIGKTVFAIVKEALCSFDAGIFTQIQFRDGLLAHFELLYFSGRSHWEGINKFNVTGDFVA